MEMKFVPRSQWGARAPRRVSRGTLSAPSTGHWNGPTVTVGGKTTWDHSSCAGLVRGIQNFHMDGKGWSDIAYNFLECPHGYTFEGRGLNVINGANGTNAGNQSSHAICCLAGGGNPFPVTEKAGFRACVRYIADKTSAPNAAKGHRDHKATECPGNVRYDWIHQGMPLTSQEEFVVDAEAKQYFDRLIASLTRIENEHFPPIQMYVDRELPGGYIKVDEKWMTPSYYRTMKIHHNVAALLARDTSVDMEEADITAIANMVAELIVPQDTGDEVPPDVQEYANAVVEAIKARL